MTSKPNYIKLSQKISRVLQSGKQEGILTLTIYLALFILDISTGLDDQVVKSIDNIGWKAFFLIVATATGCILICWIFYKTLIGIIAHGKRLTLKSEK